VAVIGAEIRGSGSASKGKGWIAVGVSRKIGTFNL